MKKLIIAGFAAVIIFSVSIAGCYNYSGENGITPDITPVPEITDIPGVPELPDIPVPDMPDMPDGGNIFNDVNPPDFDSGTGGKF